jgi:DNA mismatch repair protein MutS2
MKRKAVDQTTYEVGDRVEIISLNQRGEVDALIGKDKARVKVGNVFTTVDLRSLRKTEQDVGRSKSQDVKVSYDSERTVDREIHLRGMTAEEAREELDRFLDRAVVAGIKQVYVIHGKGSGVLRKKLTEYLRGHPEVESIRLGNWNEGGAGVTIVKLKD